MGCFPHIQRGRQSWTSNGNSTQTSRMQFVSFISRLCLSLKISPSHSKLMAIGVPLYSCFCWVDEEETVVSPSFKASQKSQWPELHHLDEKGRKNSPKQLFLRGVAWAPTGVKVAVLYWLQLIGIGTRAKPRQPWVHQTWREPALMVSWPETV